MPSLTEYGPVFAAGAAVLAAVLAWLSSRKPKLDAAQVDKITADIEEKQAGARRDKALADARRDLHIIRLEDWAFEKVRPWGRQVVTKYDQQNDLIRELAERLAVPFVPEHLPPFPDMPQLAD